MGVGMLLFVLAVLLFLWGVAALIQWFETRK